MDLVISWLGMCGPYEVMVGHAVDLVISWLGMLWTLWCHG